MLGGGRGGVRRLARWLCGRTLNQAPRAIRGARDFWSIVCTGLQVCDDRIIGMFESPFCGNSPLAVTNRDISYLYQVCLLVACE